MKLLKFTYTHNLPTVPRYYYCYITIAHSIGVTKCNSIYSKIHNQLRRRNILWFYISCEMENCFFMRRMINENYKHIKILCLFSLH
jgi:hypothetical protein